MNNERPLSEQESLQLITNMIQKVQSSHHERGTSPLLWGSVVTIASFTKFLEMQLKKELPFDIFLIVLFAIVPQIFISIKESKEKKVERFHDTAINAAWMAYGLTIFGLIFYGDIAPQMSLKFMHEAGYSLIQQYHDGRPAIQDVQSVPPSAYSLFILAYAFPTLITGIVTKFKPMLLGAVVTYALFITSLFVPTQYDMLCGSIAAIFCWLIPGFILRKRYYTQKRADV